MGVKGPTAKTILKKSIEDIEAGHWCQGNIGQRNGTTEACAVGLLSMHADYGNRKGKWFYPRYPDANAPAGTRKALAALHSVLPKDRKSEWETDEDLYQWLNHDVTSYNDESTTNEKKALAWFRKALNSLS